MNANQDKYIPISALAIGTLVSMKVPKEDALRNSKSSLDHNKYVTEDSVIFTWEIAAINHRNYPSPCITLMAKGITSHMVFCGADNTGGINNTVGINLNTNPAHSYRNFLEDVYTLIPPIVRSNIIPTELIVNKQQIQYEKLYTPSLEELGLEGEAKDAFEIFFKRNAQWYNLFTYEYTEYITRSVYTHRNYCYYNTISERGIPEYASYIFIRPVFNIKPTTLVRKLQNNLYEFLG